MELAMRLRLFPRPIAAPPSPDPSRQSADADDLRHARSIRRVAVLSLTLAVLVAGLSGFVLLLDQTRDSLHAWLQQKLHVRGLLLAEALEDARVANAEIATEPVLAEFAARRVADAGTSDGSRAGAVLPVRLAALGLSGIRLESVAGKALATQGEIAHPELDVALDERGDHRLVWHDGLILRSRVELRGGSGELHGRLILDRPLPNLGGQLTTDAAFGTTGDVRLCAPDAGTGLHCFPSERDRTVRRVPASDGWLAMRLAFAGGSGVSTNGVRDGERIVAAYAPVASGRLGLVVEQHADEVYAPIRDRVLWMAPVLALLVFAGVSLLRRRVRPLLDALARSGRESRAARDQLAAVMGSTSDGLIVTGPEGDLQFANAAAEQIFGYPRGGLAGLNIKALMPPEHRGGHDAYMKRFIERQGVASRLVGRGGIELTGQRLDGTRFTIEVAIDAVRSSDELTFVAVVRDVTARRRIEESLRLEKERLRVTLHAIGDAVVATDGDGMVTYLNPVAERLLGVASADMIGQPHEEVIRTADAETRRMCRSPVATALATNETVQVGGECTLLRPDGSFLAIEGSAAPIPGAEDRPAGVVLVFQDVTEARALVRRMAYDASHDELTGLVNRRAFEEQVRTALADEAGGTHAVLYIDLDQFKVVNDTCGHGAGDQLLRRIADELRSGVRTNDTLARLGGDEFAVLLRQCPLDAATRVADTLRRTVEAFRFVWGDRAFPIGASIGVVACGHAQTLADVLSAADSACYIAKEKGRNRVHVHRPDDADVVQRTGEMQWASRLGSALDEGRFTLYGQRIVPVHGDRAGGHLEVLVRLREDDGRIIPPMAFLPAAERYGLMPSIDRWVVEHALGALASADRAADIHLSINLSGHTLSDEGFAEFVEAAFARHGVRYDQVCFEITETAAIANIVHAERFIRWFREQGGRFSLDDFGSGLSSFAYLKRLPVDFLKIDGAFVRNLVEDSADEAMVSAVNHVGHVMGLKTVAEFVESDDILQRLAVLGVDFAQGYGIHRPEPLLDALSRGAAGARVTEPSVGRPRVLA
jgi:diguanylate cyclase (GGDEF)-like protein/PAS domain S-box-containing protein